MESFITPLVSVQSSSNAFLGKAQAANDTVIPFADVFKTAVAETYQTDTDVQQKAWEVASGDVDQLQDLTIASTKADMALRLFVQLRNKGHDAYSEIMRMGV